MKVKLNRAQAFVIGGFKPNATNSESLLVGYYEGKDLLFAGKVRAGLTPHLRAEIFRKISPDETTRCPFVNSPTSKRSHWGEGITKEDMATLRWLKPKVVVEVAFVEWTRGSLLRHAEFVGLSDDKRAFDLHREPIA